MFKKLLLISTVVFASACAAPRGADNPGALIIQEQGSFAAGGTVIANPGTYDNVKQDARAR